MKEPACKKYSFCKARGQVPFTKCFNVDLSVACEYYHDEKVKFPIDIKAVNPAINQIPVPGLKPLPTMEDPRPKPTPKPKPLKKITAGWVCPVCGRGCSPSTKYCECV